MLAMIPLFITSAMVCLFTLSITQKMNHDTNMIGAALDLGDIDAYLPIWHGSGPAGANLQNATSATLMSSKTPMFEALAKWPSIIPHQLLLPSHDDWNSYVHSLIGNLWPRAAGDRRRWQTADRAAADGRGGGLLLRQGRRLG